MITITVHGRVAAQGSKRHVGHGIMVESSKYLPSWREAVKFAAITAMKENKWECIDGPVEVTIVFTLKKPSSAPKRIRTWPAKAPDIDKCCRSTFDALTQAGVWEDDARVVKCTSEKVYPNEGMMALSVPGAFIRITSVENG